MKLKKGVPIKMNLKEIPRKKSISKAHNSAGTSTIHDPNARSTTIIYVCINMCILACDENYTKKIMTSSLNGGLFCLPKVFALIYYRILTVSVQALSWMLYYQNHSKITLDISQRRFINWRIDHSMKISAGYLFNQRIFLLVNNNLPEMPS